MSFRMLELPGMKIRQLTVAPKTQQFMLLFDGHLIKTMEGAGQRTYWQQSGEIVINNAQWQNLEQFRTVPNETAGDASDANRVIVSRPPEDPYVLIGGQMTDNVYVYPDTIRLPLHSFGDIELVLQFENYSLPLIVRGEEIEVCLRDTPKYKEHLND